MASFRGISESQSIRFKNKEKILIDSLSFPASFNSKVDFKKVDLTVFRNSFITIYVIGPWVEKRTTQILGLEDDVLVEFVLASLEDNACSPKVLQINLTGFLERETPKFVRELWDLLLSAAESSVGIPKAFMDDKKLQLKLEMEQKNAKIAKEKAEHKELKKRSETFDDDEKNPQRNERSSRDERYGRDERRDERRDEGRDNRLQRDERRDARRDDRHQRDDPRRTDHRLEDSQRHSREDRYSYRREESYGTSQRGGDRYDGGRYDSSQRSSRYEEPREDRYDGRGGGNRYEETRERRPDRVDTETRGLYEGIGLYDEGYLEPRRKMRASRSRSPSVNSELSKTPPTPQNK